MTDRYQQPGPSNYDLDKRLALMEQTVARIAVDLDGINKNLGRLVWAIVLAVVAGVMQFILRGGLGG